MIIVFFFLKNFNQGKIVKGGTKFKGGGGPWPIGGGGGGGSKVPIVCMKP